MSIIKHVTLQKIVAHDFRYDPRITLVQGKATCGELQGANFVDGEVLPHPSKRTPGPYRHPVQRIPGMFSWVGRGVGVKAARTWH